MEYLCSPLGEPPLRLVPRCRLTAMSEVQMTMLATTVLARTKAEKALPKKATDQPADKKGK